MTLRQNRSDVVKKTLTSLRDNSFTLSLRISSKSVGNFLSYKAEKESEKKRKSIIITRAKLVAKQRVGLPLMSEVKLEVPVRSRALKPITRVP